MKTPKPKTLKYHGGEINYSCQTIEELAEMLEMVGGTAIIKLNGKLYKIVPEPLNPEMEGK